MLKKLLLILLAFNVSVQAAVTWYTTVNTNGVLIVPTNLAQANGFVLQSQMLALSNSLASAARARDLTVTNSMSVYSGTNTNAYARTMLITNNQTYVSNLFVNGELPALSNWVYSYVLSVFAASNGVPIELLNLVSNQLENSKQNASHNLTNWSSIDAYSVVPTNYTGGEFEGTGDWWPLTGASYVPGTLCYFQKSGTETMVVPELSASGWFAIPDSGAGTVQMFGPAGDPVASTITVYPYTPGHYAYTNFTNIQAYITNAVTVTSNGLKLTISATSNALDNAFLPTNAVVPGAQYIQFQDFYVTPVIPPGLLCKFIPDPGNSVDAEFSPSGIPISRWSYFYSAGEGVKVYGNYPNLVGAKVLVYPMGLQSTIVAATNALGSIAWSNAALFASTGSVIRASNYLSSTKMPSNSTLQAWSTYPTNLVFASKYRSTFTFDGFATPLGFSSETFPPGTLCFYTNGLGDAIFTPTPDNNGWFVVPETGPGDVVIQGTPETSMNTDVYVFQFAPGGYTYTNINNLRSELLSSNYTTVQQVLNTSNGILAKAALSNSVFASNYVSSSAVYSGGSYYTPTIAVGQLVNVVYGNATTIRDSVTIQLVTNWFIGTGHSLLVQGPVNDPVTAVVNVHPFMPGGSNLLLMLEYAGSASNAAMANIQSSNYVTQAKLDATNSLLLNAVTNATNGFTGGHNFDPNFTTNGANKIALASTLTLTNVNIVGTLDASDLSVSNLTLANPLNVEVGGTGRTNLLSGKMLGGNGTNPVTFINPYFSLWLTNSTNLALIGDSASPGNSKYYGTDISGTRGFFDVPSPGGGGGSTVLYTNSALASGASNLNFVGFLATNTSGILHLGLPSFDSVSVSNGAINTASNYTFAVSNQANTVAGYASNSALVVATNTLNTASNYTLAVSNYANTAAGYASNSALTVATNTLNASSNYTYGVSNTLNTALTSGSNSAIIWSSNRTVTVVNAIPDDAVDDTAAINLALTNGGTVLIARAGVYEITTPLIIPSNTRFILNHNAIIKRMANSTAMLLNKADGYDGSEGTIGGYGAVSNIIVEGGTFDANGTVYTVNCTAMGFSHGYGITVRDVLIKEVPVWHGIEFNSILNGLADGVTFLNMTNEAVQIDYNDRVGGSFPWFGPSDYTPCKNIVVNRCSFINCYIGVGSHNTRLGTTHRNILVQNSSFTNLTQTCVKLVDYDDLTVSGNYAERCRSLFSVGEQTPANTNYGLQIIGNTIKNCTNGSAFHAISFARVNKVIISRNVINDCAYNGISEGGLVTDILISDNDIHRAGRFTSSGSAIVVSVGEKNARVIGNRITDSYNYGILIGSGGPATNVIVIGNSTTNQIYFQASTNAVAQNNSTNPIAAAGVYIKEVTAPNFSNEVAWASGLLATNYANTVAGNASNSVVGALVSNSIPFFNNLGYLTNSALVQKFGVIGIAGDPLDNSYKLTVGGFLKVASGIDITGGGGGVASPDGFSPGLTTNHAKITVAGTSGSDLSSVRIQSYQNYRYGVPTPSNNLYVSGSINAGVTNSTSGVVFSNITNVLGGTTMLNGVDATNIAVSAGMLKMTNDIILAALTNRTVGMVTNVAAGTGIAVGLYNGTIGITNTASGGSMSVQTNGVYIISPTNINFVGTLVTNVNGNVSVGLGGTGGGNNFSANFFTNASTQIELATNVVITNLAAQSFNVVTQNIGNATITNFNISTGLVNTAYITNFLVSTQVVGTLTVSNSVSVTNNAGTNLLGQTIFSSWFSLTNPAVTNVIAGRTEISNLSVSGTVTGLINVATSSVNTASSPTNITFNFITATNTSAVIPGQSVVIINTATGAVTYGLSGTLPLILYKTNAAYDLTITNFNSTNVISGDNVWVDAYPVGLGGNSWIIRW